MFSFQKKKISEKKRKSQKSEKILEKIEKGGKVGSAREQLTLVVYWLGACRVLRLRPFEAPTCEAPGVDKGYEAIPWGKVLKLL